MMTPEEIQAEEARLEAMTIDEFMLKPWYFRVWWYFTKRYWDLV